MARRISYCKNVQEVNRFLLNIFDGMNINDNKWQKQNVNLPRDLIRIVLLKKKMVEICSN